MTADASRLSLAELLDQIGQLQKVATPGPWQVEEQDGEWREIHNGELIIAEGLIDPPDAALIVATISALPLLLSELSRLQEARDSGALQDVAEILERFAHTASTPRRADQTLTQAGALRALAGEP